MYVHVHTQVLALICARVLLRNFSCGQSRQHTIESCLRKMTVISRTDVWLDDCLCEWLYVHTCVCEASSFLFRTCFEHRLVSDFHMKQWMCKCMYMCVCTRVSACPLRSADDARGSRGGCARSKRGHSKQGRPAGDYPSYRGFSSCGSRCKRTRAPNEHELHGASLSSWRACIHMPSVANVSSSGREWITKTTHWCNLQLRFFRVQRAAGIHGGTSSARCLRG